jgi:hypothetical protein
MTADAGPLADVVDARHLTDQALTRYRDEFTSHPANLVVLRDFLVADLADRLAAFLAEDAEFYTEYGLYSVEGAVDETAWNAAADDDRFFRMGKLAGTRPDARMSPNAMRYLRFRATFQGDAFRGFWSRATGLELAASDDFGVHAMSPGHFLRPHSDDNRNRRLALVLYLTPGWQHGYGGELVVNHPDGGSTTVVPEFNSVIAFDVLTNTSHLVRRVADTAGPAVRFTIGGWYGRP